MPCARKFGAADFLGLGVEHVDEQFADDLALGLGIVDAFQRVDERVGRIHMHQRDVVAVAEHGDDALGFGEPHQAVIDQHAGQLIADRFVNENRRDRRVDAAGQSANHFALADLGADLLDRLVLEGAHGPVAGKAGDVAHEIADQRRAVRRVHDFRMELHRVELAGVVADDRDRRALRLAEHAKAWRQFGDAVAVAHPDRVFLALDPDALEERAVGGDLDLGAAELAVMAGLDLAAELLRHRLFAVADAEHRHAGLVDRRRRQRRVFVEHRGRPAGQDHGFRLHGAEGRFGLLERHDLAIDALFAHPARDQLRHLRAEIDDQDLVVVGQMPRIEGRGGSVWGCGHALN